MVILFEREDIMRHCEKIVSGAIMFRGDDEAIQLLKVSEKALVDIYFELKVREAE